MISLFLPPLDPETWDAVPRWAWIVYGLGFLPPWVLLAWGLLAFSVPLVPMRTLPKDYRQTGDAAWDAVTPAQRKR